MRILDRYINNSIVSIFIGCVAAFCFLYVLIDITSSLDEIIDRNIPVNVLVEYYLAYIPIILVQTTSVACLIAVLFTFANLQNTNQIIAMRASGMNFWSICRPALFFGLVITAMVFFLNEQVIPSATERSKKIENENMILLVDRLKKQKEKIKNLTFYGLKNRLYYVDTYDPKTLELTGVTIVEYDNELNITQKIVALKGHWTGIAWKFFQLQITSYETGEINRPTKIKVYEEKLMDIPEDPEDFLRQQLDVNTMNIKNLQEYINRFSDSGAARALNNLKVDLHQKYAHPFGNFVIVLVGLPFALLVRNRKGMTFTAIGMAIMIGFLYYVTNAVALAFGKGGLLPPMLSAWSTPLLFTGIGIFTIESNF